MTSRFPRPIALALLCLSLIGGVGVAGAQLHTSPISTVRVAQAPVTTSTTLAPVVSTTTTTTTPAPTTSTTAAVAPSAPVKAPVTTTTAAGRLADLARVARTARTTVPPVECSLHFQWLDDGNVFVTAHVPSVPNGQLEIGRKYYAGEIGKSEAESRITGTDASGKSGIVSFPINFSQGFFVKMPRAATYLCESTGTNPDGTVANS